MLKCCWCGEIYENTESLDHTAFGWWCETCNCFTFYNENTAKDLTPLLLLEQKGASGPQVTPSGGTANRKLRRQLSPLRYPGGKSKLISYLYGQCHPDKLDTLVEVFAGGASFGLSLLDAGIIQRLVLNDIDPGVYAVWHTILNNPKELTARLHGPLPTHQDLAEAKDHLSSDDIPSPLLAWHYLLANRLSYSGIITANAQGGKNGTQEDLLCRWNPSKLIRKIEHIHSMRDRIELHRQDCCQFLEEYAWWLPKATIFIDPPYDVQGPKLYRHSFTKADHERLADTLQDLHMEFPDPAVIITYDNTPFIRGLYSIAIQQPIDRYYSI